VSFAAILDEQRARAAAAGITVEGQTARVVTSQANGTTIYRIILGPYATREQAERIGRESGKSYWVFQGAP
jgi:cell division protein FtsN